MANRRINSLPSDDTPTQNDVLPVDGSTTRKVTLKQVAEIGRPAASQAEAETGTDPSKAMTPLTVKQSIASEVGVSLASKAQGDAADSAVQPDDLGDLAAKDKVSISDIDATGAAGSGTYLRGDGTWDDAVSDAEAAADRAEAAAGSVALPSPVASTYLRRNAGNTEYEALTGEELVTALNVKGLNADGGLTFDLTAATVNQNPPGQGGTWRTALQFNLVTLDAAAGARAPAVFSNQAVGTTINGPGNGDYGLMIFCSKTDWPTSGVQGEVDGLKITVRQGTEGDTSGLLTNIVRRESASYGLTVYEASARTVDASEVAQREWKVTIGQLPATGNTDVRTKGNGLMLQAIAGTLRAGLNVFNNGGQLERIVTASSSISLADTFFYIGTGDDYETPSIHMGKGAGKIYFEYAGTSLSFKTGLDAEIFSLNRANNAANFLGEIRSGGTAVVDASRGVRFRSYSAATIGDAANAVNTANKVQGKAIYDSTNGRVLIATGSAATDPWNVPTGTLAVTPS